MEGAWGGQEPVGARAKRAPQRLRWFPRDRQARRASGLRTGLFESFPWPPGGRGSISPAPDPRMVRTEDYSLGRRSRGEGVVGARGLARCVWESGDGASAGPRGPSIRNSEMELLPPAFAQGAPVTMLLAGAREHQGCGAHFGSCRGAHPVGNTLVDGALI